MDLHCGWAPPGPQHPREEIVHCGMQPAPLAPFVCCERHLADGYCTAWGLGLAAVAWRHTAWKFAAWPVGRDGTKVENVCCWLARLGWGWVLVWLCCVWACG